MKDLYSFHADKKSLDEYYEKVREAHSKIYQRCGLKTVVLEAETGSIGGSESHEFIVLADSGEDKVLLCQKCGCQAKEEKVGSIEKCLKCKGELKTQRGIEAGHIFKLGTKYSETTGLYYLDQSGKKKLVEAGCYGIGVGRLLATVVEVHHDENGIIWPEEVAPFKYHLLVFDQSDKKNKDFADQIYQILIEKGEEVLYDDRDVSPGIKLKDADLIGLPIRLVISQKTSGKIEIKKRNEEKPTLTNLENLL